MGDWGWALPWLAFLIMLSLRAAAFRTLPQPVPPPYMQVLAGRSYLVTAGGSPSFPQRAFFFEISRSPFHRFWPGTRTW